jgi:hypothetical protein
VKSWIWTRIKIKSWTSIRIWNPADWYVSFLFNLQV